MHPRRRAGVRPLLLLPAEERFETIKTVTGIENVLDELRRGAVLMASGCTATLKRPDDSTALINRGTLRALLKRRALFVITHSGPSALQCRLLESIGPLAWVPVTERLPDDDRNVLIVDERDEVWFGWYGRPSDAPRRKPEWSYFDGTPAVVSHWMDLPPTPAGRKLQRAGLQIEGGQR